MPEINKKNITANRHKKGSKDFTREQKIEIVKRSAEVGIHKAASDYGTSWQAITAMQRKLRTEGILFHQPLNIDTGTQTEHKDAISAVNSVNITPGARAEAGSNTQVKAIGVKEYSPLEIENAILREKITALTAQVEKLRSAVSHLA